MQHAEKAAIPKLEEPGLRSETGPRTHTVRLVQGKSMPKRESQKEEEDHNDEKRGAATKKAERHRSKRFGKT